MRISDWSSDVCSSDLSADQSAFGNLRSSGATGDRRRHRRIAQAQLSSLELGTRLCNIRLRRSETRHSGVIFLLAYCLARDQPLIPIHVLLGICRRSEEHTSELQSLMRISYAVFCLKKKKTI